MEIYSYLVSACAFSALFIGIFVFSRKKCSFTNIGFLLFSVCIFIWLFFFSIAHQSKDIISVTRWFKIGNSAVIFIVITAYHLIVGLINKQEIEKRRIFVAYLIGCIFVALLWITNYFYDGLIKFNWGYYPKAGMFHPIYMVFLFSLVFYFHFLVYLKLKQFKQDKLTTEYIRSKYTLASFLIFTFAASDFMQCYGIDVFPVGFIFVTFYLILIAYAIIKHHLLDINVVIKKSLVYSLLVTIITVGYLVFVMSIGKLFQGLVGYQSFVVNIFAVIVIGVLFNPLRDRIQNFLDKRFFQGTLESLAREKERLQQQLFQTEKLAYVGQVASSAAHEIRNPLSVIKTHLEYLPKKYADPEFKKNFERLIPKEINRVENVVNQLLSISKSKKPVFREMSIANTIEAVLILLENNFRLKKINISKNYPENAVIIQGDEEQLKQVFLNLFLNSIQAMDEGGSLVISIQHLGGSGKSINKKNSLTTKPYPLTTKNYVEITIQDNGCGISEENLKRLFTPFRTTKEDGIGLGLVITKEIIEAHKGDIDVVSEIGKGTTFIINLSV